MLNFVMLLSALAGAGSVWAQATPTQWLTLSGIVTDSLTGSPLPYATVYLEGARIGALTDEEGCYRLRTRLPYTAVRVALMGHDTRIIPVSDPLPEATLDVCLMPSGVTLSEVELLASRGKYSKKGNPAVDFARRIREKARKTDPRRHTDYNYDSYERITMALNDYSPDQADSLRRSGRRFDFVSEYVDTSEVTGKPILNVAVREKGSTVSFHDGARRELIDAMRSAGIADVVDPVSLERFYDDVLGEVDIYDSEIPLLRQRFVSPLSAIAPDFYKFFLTDTVMIAADTCVELMFVPRNPSLLGFNGRLYVGLNDPDMAVRRIEMSIPRGINLNFVDNLRISQDYATAPDGSRLKLTDDLVIEARLLPATPGIYARRISRHSVHSFLPTAATDSLHAAGGETPVYLPDALERDSLYWAERRTLGISNGEMAIEEMMSRLRRERIFRLARGGLRILSEGYIPIGREARLAYGPVLKSVGLNSLEGFRVRVGGITTARLSRRWFGAGYVAYGFKDRKVKYGAEIEWSLTPKRRHAREFPVNSLRLSSSYDTEWLGQDNVDGAAEALWCSLRFARETQIIYASRQRLEYMLELPSRLSFSLAAERCERFATRWMTFVDPLGHADRSFTLHSMTLGLRYAPGEKLFESRVNRSILGRDHPIISLSHTFAPGRLFGNAHPYSATTLEASKRFWLPTAGFVTARLKGAHVWTSAPYPLLLSPDANLSYFIGTAGFNCLNPLEFINDSYLRLDLTYHARGALLGLIPALRPLKLREVAGWKGMIGHLSSRNRPELHDRLYLFPEAAHTVRMTSRPYMETFLGLENIFGLFRMEYVWRLTYRDAPHACRGGVRVGLSLDF